MKEKQNLVIGIKKIWIGIIGLNSEKMFWLKKVSTPIKLKKKS